MAVTMKALSQGLLALGAAPGLLLAQPTSVSYQGQLDKDGSPFVGQADFMFAIVDSAGATVLWSNDGNSPPTTPVVLTVDQGLFQVLLGDEEEGMQSLMASLLEGAVDPRLRIWVRAPAGTGQFEQLSDQKIASVPFALQTELGGAGSDELWQTNGTDVYRLNGAVGIGTNAPQVGLHVAGASPRARFQGTTNPSNYLEIFDGTSATSYVSAKRVTGNCSIDLNPVPLDATSASYVQVFRSVNTSGSKNMHFYRGDGTNALSGQIGAGGANSYLQLDGGNFGIGTSSPTRKLDVAGTTRTEILEISGADLVEGFDAGAPLSPGSVVVIDSEAPGKLRESTVPYDTRVAGVVSGAGGISHGIQMGSGSCLEGSTPVAMVGRVYVRCHADNGPIRPGDLLTTSNAPGTAMLASEVARRPGATIGKAMTALEQGEGLVLVLVNLQ